mgnify:FL=1
MGRTSTFAQIGRADAKEKELSDERKNALADALLACRSEQGLEAMLFRAAQAAGELLGAQAAALVRQTEASKFTVAWPEKKDQLDAGFAGRIEAALAGLASCGEATAQSQTSGCVSLCTAFGTPDERLALYAERAGAGWSAREAKLLQEFAEALAANAKA